MFSSAQIKRAGAQDLPSILKQEFTSKEDKKLDSLGILILAPSANNLSLYGLKSVVDEVFPEVTEFLKERFDPADLEIHFDKPYGIELVEALHKG